MTDSPCLHSDDWCFIHKFNYFSAVINICFFLEIFPTAVYLTAWQFWHSTILKPSPWSYFWLGNQQPVQLMLRWRGYAFQRDFGSSWPNNISAYETASLTDMVSLTKPLKHLHSNINNFIRNKAVFFLSSRYDFFASFSVTNAYHSGFLFSFL